MGALCPHFAMADPSYNDQTYKNLSTLDSLITQGLVLKFGKVFDVPTTWTTSDDDGVKMLQRQYPDLKNRGGYPYALLSLESWGMNEEKRNIRDASMRGMKVAPSTDSRVLLRAKVIPIDYSINVEHVSNDWKDVDKFAKLWMFNCLSRGLNFQVNFGMSPVDVRVVLTTSFTFPKRSANPENVQEYRSQNTLSISSYISKDLYRQDIIDTVEISAQLPESGNTQVWKITTPKQR